MEWTEVIIEINADDIDVATDIANMVVPFGGSRFFDRALYGRKNTARY